MTSTDKIRQLLKEIELYQLEAPELFKKLTVFELATIYNGAGPDWLPKWGRDITTAFLSLFEAAFLIHDVEFQFSDKTNLKFDLANNRMWKNMRKIINHLYPLWNPFHWLTRSRWWSRAFAAFRACVRFGWSAWVD